MLLLSRFWYVVLSLFCAATLYVAYLAVGQYNRRNAVAMNETIASDSQTVGWALQIDARRRLDALLIGAVDKGLQDALVGANGKDPLPGSQRTSAKRALATVQEKLPAELREDALFAVDRDGRVVGQVGFDQASLFEDFELGGYAAVFDALHGYLRDDTWVLGSKVYRVVARPVEYDVTQPPVGAIVGLRQIDARFAQELAKRTRANVAFYSAGQRVASAAGTEGFEDLAFEQIANDVPKLEGDKGYKDNGRSDVRALSENVGAMYAKLVGESWDLGAGFVVLRSKVALSSPLGFLSGADDKDKASVPVALVAAMAVLAMVIGFALTSIEYNGPLGELVRQARELKDGRIDLLPLPRFRGRYREAAEDINTGIGRIGAKGGVARKAADLESILGPTPAQPAMSAFAFPNEPSNAGPPPAGVGGSQAGPMPGPPRVTGQNPAVRPPSAASNTGAGLPPNMPLASIQSAPQQGRPAPPPVAQAAAKTAPAWRPPPAEASGGEEDEEATMVAQVPKEVLQAATGEHRAAMNEEGAEWLSVYEDFLRTKRQCGEPTDGLTFEKFQHTLRKNRDALMARHNCKRVKFSVYVKEGKASLKATPVKD